MEFTYDAVDCIQISNTTDNELDPIRYQREDFVDTSHNPQDRLQLTRPDMDEGDKFVRGTVFEAAVLKYKEARQLLLAFDVPIYDASCERYKYLAWVRSTTCPRLPNNSQIEGLAAGCGRLLQQSRSMLYQSWHDERGSNSVPRSLLIVEYWIFWVEEILILYENQASRLQRIPICKYAPVRE